MRARAGLILLVAALSMGGCALTEDTVKLSYQPRGPAQRLDEAQEVTVVVVVRDERRSNERDRVSCKKNGYGMEMAAIRSANDVPGLVKGSIQTELGRRGFKAGPSGVTVVVELRRLYSDFHPGFFSGDATADADLEVSVFAPGATEGTPPLFAGRAEGAGSNQNIQLSSGENAKPALEGALSEAVWNLFNNQRFVAALFLAGQMQAAPAQPVGGSPPQS
jgi:uncharacterized lipoprotein YajG